MKRVLVIAYYWPPSAGSGVQRWLKFSKYLPQNGWQPVIYTPENPDFSTKDDSLLSDVPSEVEVIKTKIWEPYSAYRSFSSSSNKNNINNGLIEGGENQSIIKRKLTYLSKWVRGNLFIPDPKVYWVKKSVKFLENYLSEHPVDAMVTTGPPHSMHLIGLQLKTKTGIPWIADFRDPWSKLDLLDDYHITKSNRGKYEALEQEVIRVADVCLTVSNNWGEMFRELGAKNVEVITNGYDTQDVAIKENKESEKFIVSHFGLLNHLRNPQQIWNALEKACIHNEELNKQLEIHLGGTIDQSVLSQFDELPNLKDKVTVHGYITHSEVLKWYQKSSLLLLLTFNSEIGKGNIPGKLFEYLAMYKPIIAFGQEDGDVAEILGELKSGKCYDYSTEKVDEITNEILHQFLNKGSTDKNHSVERYNRENLTKSLVNLLDKLAI